MVFAHRVAGGAALAESLAQRIEQSGGKWFVYGGK
jgi:hypothetical protein